MREVIFFLVYGLAVACVSFTVITVLGLPSAFSIVIGVFAIALADRVGMGFGVQPFGRLERDREVSTPKQGSESQGDAPG